ncbi:MAG: hypothetical protein GX851_07105 [Clostridiales bacterium]|nr:hypothetical protein [Clostridiales bacterium]
MLLASAVYGVNTKASYTNYITPETDFSGVTVFEKESELLSDGTASTIRTSKENLLSADIIVKVKFSGQREQVHFATKSMVSVTEVIKGDRLQVGESFYLFEPSWFGYNPDEKNIYFMRFSRLNIMQKDSEYIVFANEIKYDEEYSKTLKVKEYIYADRNCPYFMADFTVSEIYTAENSSFPILWGDVGKNEFICCSDYQLNEMNAYKREIFKEV